MSQQDVDSMNEERSERLMFWYFTGSHFLFAVLSFAFSFLINPVTHFHHQ